MKKDKLSKFNLEDSVAGGPIRINRQGFLDFDNIILSEDKSDYLIHVKYFKKENRYGFSAYKEKKK